jgi:hypothetical protein
MRAEHCLRLIKSASDLPFLHEIGVSPTWHKDIDNTNFAALILPSLRGNGTLHRVSVSEVEYFSDSVCSAGPLGESGMKLVNAFCQRNKCLEQLVGSNVFEESSNSGDDGDVGPGMSDNWLYPSLLCAARQVPKTFLQLLLGSLIARGDSVGKQESRKRTTVGTRSSNTRRKMP